MNLTDRIRELSQTLVRQHCASEAPFFDQLWHVFWRRLNCERVEDFTEPLRWDRSAASMSAFGAVGDGSGEVLDSLYVVGSLVGAALEMEFSLGDCRRGGRGLSNLSSLVATRHGPVPGRPEPVRVGEGSALAAARDIGLDEMDGDDHG